MASSPALCSKCNGEFKRNEKNLSCNGWCDQIFHPKCVKVSDEIWKIITEVNNILWCCDQCCTMKQFTMRKMVSDMRMALQGWRKDLDKCAEGVKEQETAISTLTNTVREKYEEINSSIKKVAENEHPNKALYADKLKMKKNEPVLVVKPKNEGQKSVVTKEAIKSSIDPTTIEISGVKHASRGGIIIECKNQEAVSKLKEEAETKLGSQYNISVPKKRKPRIKIVGMSNRMTGNEIETKIMTQNHFLEQGKANLSVVHVGDMKNRKTPCYFAYAELEAESYSKMLKEGKVNIEWDRCKVFDAVTVTRCFKCNSYNHRAKECKKELTCPKCAGSHHVNDCNAEKDEIKCVNCKEAVSKLKLKIDIHHEAWNTECPVYKRKLEIERNKINFLE